MKPSAVLENVFHYRHLTGIMYKMTVLCSADNCPMTC